MNDLSSNNPSYSARELLLWYKHAGIDVALGDEPVDQFALSKELASSRKKLAQEKAGETGNEGVQNIRKTGAIAAQPPARMSGQNSSAAMPDENAVNSAREKAKAAGSIDELREVVGEFKGCNLRLSAKKTVFADGNPAADIMLIGEAPGRDEDLQGLPFVGHSGRLLDLMLAAIKLDRQNTYLTNVIPWRPPGNRTPTDQEIEICRPFVERHIELVNPKLIIVLGGPAAKMLLNSTQGIVKLRGRWKTYELGERQIDTMTIFHPAYLLTHPAQKKMAWQDLLKIKQKLLES